MNLNTTSFFKWIVIQSLAADNLEAIISDMHKAYYEIDEAKFYAQEQAIIRETMHNAKLQQKKLGALTNIKNAYHAKQKKQLNDFLQKCRDFTSVFNYEQTESAKKYLQEYVDKNIVINEASK